MSQFKNSRLPEIVERLKRVVNLEVTLDKSGLGYKFRLPGFKYDDFDRSGHPSVLKLNRQANIGRSMHRDLLATDHNSLDYFSISNHWNVSKLFYDSAALELPTIQRGVINHIGDKSLHVLQTFRLVAKNNEPPEKTLLASRILRLVNVDPVSRKSVVIPDTIRQKILDGIRGLDDIDKLKNIPDAVAKLAIPEGSFSCKILVRHDDTDQNLHTNQATYLGFALECAAKAALSGQYKHFTEDICFYRIKSISSLYMGESFAGDELVISTCQNVTDPYLLHFTAQKNDMVIDHTNIRFYED